MMTLRQMWRAGFVAMVGALAIISSIQAADSNILPDDTEIIFSINVRQILGSELVKANKEVMDQLKFALVNDAGDDAADVFKKYLKSTGFDLFHDLHSITVAGNGSKEPTVFIVRGTFDADKLAATAAQAAKDNPGTIKITKSGDRNVYEFAATGANKGIGFATLVDNKVLLATSSAAGLSDALERLAGTKKASLKKEFAVLLDTVNDQQSVNFVATGAALAKVAQNEQVPNGQAAAMALQNIDGMSGALTVTKEVQFQIGINAHDEASAKKMAQDGTGMLLGAQFLMAQQAKKDDKLAPIVDIVKTLRITTQGSNVLLRGNVSFDVVEKLMKNFNQ
jgi:hypothetical protein